MRFRTTIVLVLLVMGVLAPAGAGAAPVTCFGVPVTIPAGGPGPDVINGTSGPDVIAGLGGDDVIRGFGGADLICGGDGDDLILGGPGNDRLAGDDGNDKLRGAAGDDELRGGAGSDRLLPDTGDDILIGGGGSDIVDYLAGHGPIDVDLAAGTAVYTPPGKTFTSSLAGIEKVDGTPYDDTIAGDAKRNVLRGKHGRDTIDGRGGNDTIAGGTGEDLIHGGDAGDVIRGQGDGDVLHGDDGPDIVRGGNGDDLILGLGGDDRRLVGDTGHDTIYGGAGDDLLRGGRLAELGSYDDLLDGEGGTDGCFTGTDYFNCETTDAKPVHARQDGIGDATFGMEPDRALRFLRRDLGQPDFDGPYQGACGGESWRQVRWDGLTVYATDMDDPYAFDGWRMDTTKALPAGVTFEGGILPAWTWSNLAAAGATYDIFYQAWRLASVDVFGWFGQAITDPPAPNTPIGQFGTGSGGVFFC
jgi:Ca2+-binding RTX toxin-like protein